MALYNQILLGLLFSLIIAAMAFQKKSLSLSGAMVAVLVGTIIYSFGSVAWYGLLLSFFISSSLLSKWKEAQKKELADRFDKNGARDGIQVLVNGGWGAFLPVAAWIHPWPGWYPMFLGAMAAANSDTWATELGVLSQKKPRHILSGKPVEKGLSGGVTAAGFMASITGGLFIGLMAFLLTGIEQGNFETGYIWMGLVSGLAGSLADSLAGGVFQLKYVCQICQKETEKKMHCGVPCQTTEGWTWMNNDTVNLVGSVTGSLVAWLMFLG
ncbi:MAG: DUF92 domain-containing protein [Bacillaceae bacterium]|nr:DUF92 domain-containing protein [Bacillaceae bacterium]